MEQRGDGLTSGLGNDVVSRRVRQVASVLLDNQAVRSRLVLDGDQLVRRRPDAADSLDRLKVFQVNWVDLTAHVIFIAQSFTK